MSATMSVQEALPLEGADPCQFVVLSEDTVAHDSAMEVCGGVMARFEAELAFAFSFWEFKDLANPASAHWAAEAVARADIILFSLQGNDPDPGIINWLDACARVRTKMEGALAVIVTEPRNPGLVETLLSRIQFIAQRLRMDFLPLVPSYPDAGMEASTEQLSAVLYQAGEDPGSNHWGLNE
jgi:hypothetical protein